MKKKIVVPVMALTLLISGAYFTGQAFANEGETGQHPMISRLAERFNLNQDELTSFFEESRQERQAEMQGNFETMLDSAVANGELTTEQKDLILKKHEEMRAEREANRGEQAQERGENREAHRDEMETKRAELEAWAEENGIDFKYFAQNQKGEAFSRRGGRGPLAE